MNATSCVAGSGADDEALAALARVAGRLLGAPTVCVLHGSGEAAVLRVFTAGGEGSPGAELPLLRRLCHEVAQAAHPLAWRDVGADRIGSGCDAGGLATFAGVPLHANGRGQLCAVCVAGPEPRDWTDDDLCLLRDLAVMAAARHLASGREEPLAPLEDAREVAEGLAAIVEASPLAIIATDTQGNIELWSPAAERMFGWSQDEVLRRPLPIVPVEFTPEYAELRRRALAGDRLLGVEGVRLRRDGSAIDVSVSTAPLTGPDGTVRGTMVAVEDITERRRRDDELRRSEERFRFLFQRSPLATWVVDSESLRFLDVNEAAVRQYGYSREEFLSMDAGRLHAPEALGRLRQVLASGGAELAALRHLRRDGSLIDVEISTGDVQYSGRPAVLVTVLDVTERKKADDRLRFLETAGRVLGALFEYEDRLESTARLAVPALADFCTIDVLREDGRLARAKAVHADPSKEPLLAVEPYHPAPAESGDGVAAALGGQAGLLEHASDEALRTGGDAPPASLGVRAVMRVPLAARGRMLGIMTLASTDPARRFTPEDLSLAAELAGRAALLLDNSRLFREAQEATCAREEILAVVSHELRNPLHAIVVLVDTLLQWLPSDSFRARERRQLESIHQVSRQMARLVQDLLDVTRIEGGHFSIRPGEEEVGSVLEESLESLLPVAEGEGVQLQVQAGEGLPAAHADRQRIAQVLVNLVSNALRVTPRGGVVTVGVESSGSDLLFRVSDTGPGIPEDHLPRLFQRFWRPAGATGLGAGLGLTIARGIVEAHGGRIWVETSPQGSTFWFTVPAAARDDREPRAESYDAVVLLPPPGRPADRAEDERQQEAERERAAAERQARFSEEFGAGGEGPGGGDGDILAHLREQIATALHLGHIHVGDRLPSIRDISRRFGVTTYTAVHAYEGLAAEGLVEKRGRSGMYVAPQDRLAETLLGETANWLADVLSGACEHQIKIPHVPDLVRRWTAAVRLRAACVESDADTRAALCSEVTLQFGLSSRPVSPDDLTPTGGSGARQAFPGDLEDADLLITTAYHAPMVRACADALGKPVLVVGMNPDHAHAVEERLRAGSLTVVCVDPRFGDRVRSMRGGRYADRVRIVSADDREALASLDPAEPVLLSRAAHERLDGADLRPLVPLSPFLSPTCARSLVRTLVRFNVEARRA